MKPLSLLFLIPFIALGKPNIVFILADDLGYRELGCYGQKKIKTPNIDRIAREGVGFTDYYAQQSCTAGRAAFIGGSVPLRNGMLKVGLPGAKEGWQKVDVTMATVLKSQGYATGQFGKNHQGDRDEHLPTMQPAMGQFRDKLHVLKERASLAITNNYCIWGKRCIEAMS